MPVSRNYASLRADNIGTAIIELALVLPLVLFLILGALDFSLGFVARLKLEQSVNTVLEEALTVGPGSNNYGYLVQEAASVSGQPTSNVTLTTWLECDGIVQANFAGDCTGTQVIARYVGLKIDGSYSPPIDYGGFASMFKGTPMSTMAISGFSRLRIQ